MPEGKIVFIDYRGVIGDIFLPDNIESRIPKRAKSKLTEIQQLDPKRLEFLLYLRPQVVKELQELQEDSTIVATTTLNLVKFHYFREYLKSQGFQFDINYDIDILKPHIYTHPALTDILDFSLIYQQLDLQDKDIETKVLNVQELRSRPEKILSSSGNELLCNGSKKEGFYVIGTPMPYNGNVPVSLLVPNLLYQDEEQQTSITMFSVRQTIEDLFKLGQGDFYKAFGILEQQQELFGDRLKTVRTYKHRDRNNKNSKGVPLEALTGNFEHRYIVMIPNDNFQNQMVDQVTQFRQE